jgi:hypothetical protein
MDGPNALQLDVDNTDVWCLDHAVPNIPAGLKTEGIECVWVGDRVEVHSMRLSKS